MYFRSIAPSRIMAIGAGAAAFLVVVGVVVGAVGEGVVRVVGFSTAGGRMLRGLVAAVVISAGLVQLGVIRLPLGRLTRLAQPIERQRISVADRHRRGAQALYGFGFVLAGFG